MGRAIGAQLKTAPMTQSGFEIFVYSRRAFEGRDRHRVLSPNDLFSKSDLLFMCIKPQDFYELTPFNRKDTKHLVVVSIMAGVRVAHIQKVFPGAKVVRTMPNLPLQIGQGVIGWYRKKGTFKRTAHAQFQKLFSVFGFSVELKNEKMLDSLTAVAGSGPAYVFLFLNALIKAAQKIGFNKILATQIVTATVRGSLAYLSSIGNADLEQLIERVRSKGGTTEAALNTLKVNKYYAGWHQAVLHAYMRSKELSSHEDTRT